MPQIYRRHTDYTPRTVPPPARRASPTIVLTDADDAIVLSDLVRTGEASRLRRRGALRIDHAAIAAAARPLSIPPPPQQPQQLPLPRLPLVPAQTAPLTPPWATPDVFGDLPDSSDAWQGWDTYEEPLLGSSVPPDEPRRPVETEDEEAFVLYCGGEAPAKVPSHDYSAPFTPSPLALPRRTSKPPARPAPSTSNGCGALVHLRAFPQRTRGVFVGKAAAPSSVVPLPASYFDRAVVARMMRSACGCVREGVGCAACGNPLGTRYAPCAAAAEGIFRPAHTAHEPCPPHPRVPQGQAYYAQRGARPPPPAEFFVYNFFADRVEAAPAPHVPSPSPPSTRTNSWLGSTPVASPRPVSPSFAPAPPELYIPSEPYPLPERYTADGTRVDADGVRLDADGMAEPGSPNKDEGVMWPGR